MVYAEGAYETEVRALIEASPTLRECVRLVGRVGHADMEMYYRAADLFVSASHHEGSGYAALEAIACGATPVLTSIGPFRAITDNGAIGALWTPREPASLATALTRAWHGGELNRDVVVEHFNRRFTWQAIAQVAMTHYRDAASRRSHAPLLTSRGVSNRWFGKRRDDAETTTPQNHQARAKVSQDLRHDRRPCRADAATSPESTTRCTQR